MKDVLGQVLEVKKTGSKELKNDLLCDLQGEAKQLANIHCNKKLGRDAMDEEVSIALEAIDDAINRYDSKEKAGFWTFASKVILSRLRDFFRKQKREKEKNEELIPFDNQDNIKIFDMQAMNQFHSEDIARQRKEEILKFERIVGNLGYSVDEIIENRPKHRDSIEKLHSIALHIVNQRLGERFLKERPISRELRKLIGVGGRMLTKYRPYLCALIIAHTFDFPVMKNYLNSLWKEVQKHESL